MPVPARAAASVSHPNVCQLDEVGEANGELFIAMELLEGEPLSARLARGPIPLPESVEITLAVLSALEAIHARGIVHRDLKPSNIFLTAHGIKLLDFGLAVQEVSEQTQAGITMPGIVMGTPHYMSPEQLSGSPLDGRSDLFAVSAILFELLVGKAAFPGRLVFGSSLVVLLVIAAVYSSLASLGRPPEPGRWLVRGQRMTKCFSHRTVPSAPRSSTFQSPACSGVTVLLLNVRYPLPGLAATRSRLTCCTRSPRYQRCSTVVSAFVSSRV